MPCCTCYCLNVYTVQSALTRKYRGYLITLQHYDCIYSVPRYSSYDSHFSASIDLSKLLCRMDRIEFSQLNLEAITTTAADITQYAAYIRSRPKTRKSQFRKIYLFSCKQIPRGIQNSISFIHQIQIYFSIIKTRTVGLKKNVPDQE